MILWFVHIVTELWDWLACCGCVVAQWDGGGGGFDYAAKLLYKTNSHF